MTTFDDTEATLPPGYALMKAEDGAPLAVRADGPEIDAVQPWLDPGLRRGVWVLHPGDRWQAA